MPCPHQVSRVAHLHADLCRIFRKTSRAVKTLPLRSTLWSRWFSEFRLSGNEEEKLAAVSTLKNLADEPTNLIPMTNTPDCFATLMQVAHGQDGNTTEMMQFLACDALATLSHWLRKIASTESRFSWTQGQEGWTKGRRRAHESFTSSYHVVSVEVIVQMYYFIRSFNLIM